MKSSKRDFNKIKFSSEEKKEYWKKLDFFSRGERGGNWFFGNRKVI